MEKANVLTTNSDMDDLIVGSRAFEDMRNEIRSLMLKQLDDAIAREVLGPNYNEILNKEYEYIKMTPVEVQDLNIELKNISCDKDHKCITDEELSNLRNKPTKDEVEILIKENNKEIDEKINTLFDRVLNNKDILDKLKTVSNAIQTDETCKVLSNVVTRDEFEEHSKSEYHLNDLTGGALLAMMNLFKDGVHWDDIIDTPNAMRADGGDADSVSGFGISALLTKQDSLIIGIADGGYNMYNVDLCIASNYNNIKDIMSRINKVDGSIIIREGTYIMKEFSFEDSQYGRIVKGCGPNTLLKIDSITLDNNIELRDMSISNADVHIKSNCKISNVTFDNCTIIFEDSELVKIIDNRFNSCSLSYKNTLFGSIITNNIFKSCFWTEYIGGNNIINNNVNI